MSQKSVTIHKENGLEIKLFTIFAVVFVILLAFFYYNNLIDTQTGLLIVSLTSLASVGVLSYLFFSNPTCIITIDDQNLTFPLHRGGKSEEISLSIADIDYFETRFNKIIIHDIHQKTFFIALDRVKCENKRWEVKELLRTHLRQRKQENHLIENNNQPVVTTTEIAAPPKRKAKRRIVKENIDLSAVQV